MYRSLKSTELLRTVKHIHLRASKTFPEASLSRVAGEMIGATKSAMILVEKLEKPRFDLRALSAIAVLLLIAFILFLIKWFSPGTPDGHIGDFLEGFDAGMHALVLIGGAIFFLVTMEIRSKRAQALKSLNELRSLAHIVDMHQLSKDPRLAPLAGLPFEEVELPDDDDVLEPRALNNQELIFYLDLCSEMLAMLGKLAALHAQHMRDRLVLDTVTEIENLTTGLSQKIWTKIQILHRKVDVED